LRWKIPCGLALGQRRAVRREAAVVLRRAVLTGARGRAYIPLREK
jgi:hypothetical protein